MNDLIETASQRVAIFHPGRVVLAVAQDKMSLQGLILGKNLGLIEPVLIGQKNEIADLLEKLGQKVSQWKIIDEHDHIVATQKAVKLILNGKADILMRGKLLARDFFTVLFDPSLGLKKNGELWSNIVVLEIEGIPRLILLTDCALIVEADLNRRLQVIQNATEFAQFLGIKEPKVALLAAVETVTPGMPVSLEEAIIAKMSERGQFPPGVQVDGPLSLDLSLSPEAVEKKKIKSTVAGYADILVTNNIHVGNVLFKSLITLCGAKSASVVVGAPFPIILTSRSESPENIINSLALSILMRNENLA
ncbi:MAG: phosphate acyltransferase [bacterium]